MRSWGPSPTVQKPTLKVLNLSKLVYLGAQPRHVVIANDRPPSLVPGISRNCLRYLFWITCWTYISLISNCSGTIPPFITRCWPTKVGWRAEGMIRYIDSIYYICTWLIYAKNCLWPFQHGFVVLAGSRVYFTNKILCPNVPCWEAYLRVNRMAMQSENASASKTIRICDTIVRVFVKEWRNGRKM